MSTTPSPAQRLRREALGLGTRLSSLHRQGIGVWLGVVGIALLSATQSELFLTAANFSNVLGQLVVPGLVTLGQTIVVLGGAVDLSVGSVVLLTSMLTAGLIDGDPSRIILVVPLMLLLGIGIGAANGLLATVFRIPSFLVTLGTLSIIQGIALSYSLIPVGSIPPEMAALAFSQVGPFPVTFLVFAGVAVICHFLVSRFRFGRHLLATGGDPVAARQSGVNVNLVTLASLTISGFLAASAGVFQAIRTGVGTPTAGIGLELLSVTAVVLGGVSIFGGSGTVLGAMGGATFLVLIPNSFNLAGVPSVATEFIRGLVIVIAAAIFVGVGRGSLTGDSRRTRRRTRQTEG
jgi:ribose/xylose/arabinose/galactoside ABC-type transport system permease subunit